MRTELQKKIDQAIRLIKSTCEGKGVVEIAYSGGKDSDVILQLAKEARIEYRAIYKSTTIDPPGTIKHAQQQGAEILRPKHSFFELIKKKGYPHRLQRFCCSVLKEYKVLDIAIIGVRASESRKRSERYKEPTQCRTFSKKEGDKAKQIYPILFWNDQDIAEFIEDRHIKCHSLYYDENGNFDVKKRLGCQGCPLVSRKKRIEYFKQNPKMLRAWIRAGLKYNWKHLNAYEQMAKDLLFENYGRFMDANKTNLFGIKTDWKAELERVFNIDLTI